MHFVVKLFPEITVKSPPVRKRMIRQLRDNLRRLLHPLNDQLKVARDWEKIEITGPQDAVLKVQVDTVLSRTPGIANFSYVQKFPLGDLADITKKTLAIWGDALTNKTFVVRVKRSGNHNFTSHEVEREVGGDLLHQSKAAGVSLKHPEVMVRLEIRHEFLYVLEQTTPGLGGYPLGSQNAVLSLISGGYDSTVSSYLTMKRGLLTHFLFFNMGGRSHEVGVKEVAFYLWNKFGASHRVKFITVPFEAVTAEILSKVHHSYMGVVLKRMMLRAGAEILEDFKAQALVTGESVAQVSSQTLVNLSVIDAVTSSLVLRPLVAYDKLDIINLARQIGTEEFAANMPEYCGVISRKPTTCAKMDRVEAQENNFDFSVFQQALASRQVQNIDQVVNNTDRMIQIDMVETPQPGMVILDIRHPDEVNLRPLTLSSNPVQTIPFYTLQSSFKVKDGTVQYLLYCDRGVMSRLHAELLVDQGFANVGIYRPT